jgi:phage/plasmid-associated DNA primase
MKPFLNANKDQFLNQKGKLVGPRETAKLLLELSNLKNSKYYPQFDSYYVYDETEHIYIDYNKSAFIIIVTQILSLLDYQPITDYQYVRNVVKNLSTFYSHGMIGVPQVDDYILVFNNCIYNLLEKKVEEFNPDYLVVGKLPYDYIENTEMLHFKQYLEDLCEGHADRKQFVRSFLYVLLFGPGKLQCFFYIYGLSGSGKSTLSKVAQCLIGKNLCVTSSLNRISKDPFEIANLANKKLILISENENWTTQTSTLKMISSGDPLPGRIKHLQGSFEINIIGVLAIFNNFKFEVRDETGAISRRIKQFRADNSVKEKKDLLRYSPKFGWQGLLVKEMSAIFNWVLDTTRDKVDYLLENIESQVPSLSEEVTNSKLMFNQIFRWVTEEVVPGGGAYLGVQSERNIKNDLESKNRKTLYPAYHRWCSREGITPLSKMRFTNSLMNALRERRRLVFCATANLPAFDTRKSAGIYVSGIQLNDKIFNGDIFDRCLSN